MSKKHETWLRFGRVMVVVVGLWALRSASAEVRLTKVFGSRMVLQREKPIPVWGWAQPGETVTVQFREARQEAKANERGEWKATLPAM